MSVRQTAGDFKVTVSTSSVVVLRNTPNLTTDHGHYIRADYVSSPSISVNSLHI